MIDANKGIALLQLQLSHQQLWKRLLKIIVPNITEIELTNMLVYKSNKLSKPTVLYLTKCGQKRAATVIFKDIEVNKSLLNKICPFIRWIYIYIYICMWYKIVNQSVFCTILSIQEVSTYKMINIISSKHKIPHMHEKCMARGGDAQFIVKDVHYNYTSQRGPNSSLCPWRFSDYILETNGSSMWHLFVAFCHCKYNLGYIVW